MNMLSWNNWTTGTGGVSGYAANGLTSENHRFEATDPWGNNTIVWEARPSGDGSADGGWNTNNTINIDNTKMYRFSVWVNRTVKSTSGGFYLGFRGVKSNGMATGVKPIDNDTATTNPYFYSVGNTSSAPSESDLPTGEWILVVGHVWPVDTPIRTTHPDSGRYRVTGRLGTVLRDFRWMSDNVRTVHRSYLYYANNTDARQRWCYPRIDLIDGNQPTIQDLLDDAPGGPVMARKIYRAIETPITFHESGGSAVITLKNLGAAAIRASAQYTLGTTQSLPYRFRWRGIFQWGTAPNATGMVQLFIAEASTIGTDGNLSSVDQAITEDWLINMRHIGKVVVQSTTANVDNIASGVCEIFDVAFQVVVRNRAGAAFRNTDNASRVIFTPIPEEIQ